MRQYHKNRVNGAPLFCGRSLNTISLNEVGGMTAISSPPPPLLLSYKHRPPSSRGGRKGLRDSSSHNTRQVLIASRLLKVNVILTFQSLSLIAFFKSLTVTAGIRGDFLWTCVFSVTCRASVARAKVIDGVCERLWSCRYAT